jgi:hypothetical protein
MSLYKRCLIGLLLLVLAGVCGCTKPPTVSAPQSSDEEPQVRARFAQFQKALKERDAAQLWAMLAKQTQTDGERAARTLHAEYDKADDATKGRMQKELGLSAADLAQLTGRDLVRTKIFDKRYEEPRDGKFERAIVQGDQATVYFRDEEGDEEKLILLREEGQWKLWLKIPTVHLTES